MRINKLVAGLLAAVLCLGLTGCGKNAIPELTEGDLQAIGEYAAITLMKYDASNRSRLVTLPPEPAPTVPGQPEQEKPSETGEPSGTEPADNTPTTDLSQQENPGSLEETLGLAEGLSVSYVDAELCDVYPNGDEIGGFAVSASEGKKLLVLHFQLLNGTGQEQAVDLLSQKDLVFRVTVNGDYRRNAMPSGLLDDMAALQETIPAGESVEAVLLIEVPQESMEEISTISLNLKNDVKEYKIQLK